MGSRRHLNRYKMLLNALGVRELDVYRVTRGGRTVDVIRVYDEDSGRVVLVDLGAARESLSLGEFVDRVVELLGKSGVQVSERRIARVKSFLSRAEGAGKS